MIDRQSSVDSSRSSFGYNDAFEKKSSFVEGSFTPTAVSPTPTAHVSLSASSTSAIASESVNSFGDDDAFSGFDVEGAASVVEEEDPFSVLTSSTSSASPFDDVFSAPQTTSDSNPGVVTGGGTDAFDAFGEASGGDDPFADMGGDDDPFAAGDDVMPGEPEVAAPSPAAVAVVAPAVVDPFEADAFAEAAAPEDAFSSAPADSFGADFGAGFGPETGGFDGFGSTDPAAQGEDVFGGGGDGFDAFSSATDGSDPFSSPISASEGEFSPSSFASLTAPADDGFGAFDDGSFGSGADAAAGDDFFSNDPVAPTAADTVVDDPFADAMDSASSEVGQDDPFANDADDPFDFK